MNSGYLHLVNRLRFWCNVPSILAFSSTFHSRRCGSNFFTKMKLLIKTNGSYSRLEISFLGVTKVAFVPCWTLSHKLGLWGNCSLWPLMACKTGVRVFKSNFFAIVVTIWWIRQYTLLIVYIYGVIKSPCRLVYLLPNFWRPFLCFQGGFF